MSTCNVATLLSLYFNPFMQYMMNVVWQNFSYHCLASSGKASLNGNILICHNQIQIKVIHTSYDGEWRGWLMDVQVSSILAVEVHGLFQYEETLF